MTRPLALAKLCFNAFGAGTNRKLASLSPQYPQRFAKRFCKSCFHSLSARDTAAQAWLVESELVIALLNYAEAE